jgi:hypothetical protein
MSLDIVFISIQPDKSAAESIVADVASRVQIVSEQLSSLGEHQMSEVSDAGERLPVLNDPSRSRRGCFYLLLSAVSSLLSCLRPCAARFGNTSRERVLR